jgi:preprotein translocase subunit SecE
MATVTNEEYGKDRMSDEDLKDTEQTDRQAEESDEREDRPRAVQSGAAEQARTADGFFHIYKSGQGYWVRMGSAAAATVIAIGALAFLWEQLRSVIVDVVDGKSQPRIGIIIIILSTLLVAYGLLIFRLLNKPRNADFLIATESEMRKVNWTSRKELIGSTKVVIFFMFLIAVILFVYDYVFAWFFWAIRVLKEHP